MANIVDRKWNPEREIDSEDPLMQLSRIMSESSARQDEPHLEHLNDSEAELDLLLDDKYAEDDIYSEAQQTTQLTVEQSIKIADKSVPELSIEDELAALLSDAPEQAGKLQYNPEPELTGVSFDPAIKPHDATSPSYWDDPVIEAKANDEAAIESVDDQFETDPWQNMELDIPAYTPDYQSEISVEATGTDEDPVLEQIRNSPAAQMQNFTIGKASEPNIDPQLAIKSPPGYSRANITPSATEFDQWKSEALLTEPELDFDFSEDFERLLAETAPEPVVEPAIVSDDQIVATENFDIPEFEFNVEPEIAVAADHHDDYETSYRVDQAPLVVARAVPVYTSATLPAQISDEIADFDTILNDELSVDLDHSIGGYNSGQSYTAPARSDNYSPQNQMNPSNFDQIDEFEAYSDHETNGSASFQQKPVRSRSRLVAALAGILVLSGAGYYAYSKSTSSTIVAGGPVLLKADPQPVKVAPETPGGKVVADQDKAVYDKVAGAQEMPAKPNQLVTASEEPVDIAAIASDPVDEGDNADNADVPVVAKIATPAVDATPVNVPKPAANPAATQGKAEDRVDPALDPENAPPPSADATAIAPKKVRTFIVKSDGTLVERPATPVVVEPIVVEKSVALAPAIIKKVIEPAKAFAPEPVAKAGIQAPAVTEEKPVANNAAADVIAPAEKQVEIVAPKEKIADATKVVKTKKIKAPATGVAAKKDDAGSGTAPVIEGRPADQPVTIVGKTGGKKVVTDAQVAALAASQQPVADQSPVATGAFVMQIASTPSADAAKATYAALSRKFSGVLGGRGVNIQQAEVAGKGTVFRIRIPAGSKQDANALCAQYKSSGGSCFVSK